MYICNLMCQFLQWWCKTCGYFFGTGFLSGENTTRTRVWCLSCFLDSLSESRAICANSCIIRDTSQYTVKLPHNLLCFLGVFNTKILIVLKHAFWLHLSRTALCYGMEPYTIVLPRLLNIRLINSSPLLYFNHPHMA